MKNETGYFEGRKSKKLFFQYWLPDTEDIKAYVIVLHDLATHSDRMKRLAEYLTEKRYGLFSFDLRGHWRSAGNYLGHIDSMDHLQKDLVLFTYIVRKHSVNKKIFLMGHSFGGLISLIYGINHPNLPGVIVSCPLLGLSKKMSFGKKITKKMSAKLSPTKIIPYIIDQKHLTSDLKILRQFIRDDNKLENISVKTASEIDKSMKWVMDYSSKLVCPTFIMQGENDKIVDIDKTKEFFENVKSKDKNYKLYEGFLHDLLNEKNRNYIYQEIFKWLEKHL